MTQVNVLALKEAGFSPAEIIQFQQAVAGTQSVSRDVTPTPGVEPNKGGLSLDVSSVQKIDQIAKDLGVKLTEKFRIFKSDKKGYLGLTSADGSGFRQSKFFAKIAGVSGAMDLERAYEFKKACDEEMNALLEAHDVAEEMGKLAEAIVKKLTPSE
jgi:hypothetical protein